MRADARNLLDRLGKQDFAYKEFTDRFSDLELWPAFEALLNDKRLFSGADEPALAQEFGRPQAAATPAPAEAPRVNLFARYDEHPQSRPASSPAPQTSGESAPAPALDVRGMLQQLNDLAENGGL